MKSAKMNYIPFFELWVKEAGIKFRILQTPLKGVSFLFHIRVSFDSKIIRKLQTVDTS